MPLSPQKDRSSRSCLARGCPSQSSPTAMPYYVIRKTSRAWHCSSTPATRSAVIVFLGSRRVVRFLSCWIVHHLMMAAAQSMHGRGFLAWPFCVQQNPRLYPLCCLGSGPDPASCLLWYFVLFSIVLLCTKYPLNIHYIVTQ